jgi:EamA domain-containing membrane protein RarD
MPFVVYYGELQTAMKKGVLFAVVNNLLWGFLPIY